MSNIIKLCFFALAVFCWPLAVSASEWVVVKTTRQVSYTIDRHSWIPVQAGLVIPNKAWVSTGPRGRLVLARGPESISFQPNSMASVQTQGGRNRQTQVYQPYGTLEFNIETRDKPHTSVQTPFLAAVVKGTRFQVHVTRKTASVDVQRGLVEVTELAHGQRVHVGPRQSVKVDVANPSPLRVTGVGPKDVVKTVSPVTTRVLTRDEIETNSVGKTTKATTGTQKTNTAKGKSEDKDAGVDDESGKHEDKGTDAKGETDKGDKSKDKDTGKGKGDTSDKGKSDRGDRGDKGKGDKGHNDNDKGDKSKDRDKDKDKDKDKGKGDKSEDKGKDKGKSDKGDKGDKGKGDKGKGDKGKGDKDKDKGKGKDKDKDKDKDDSDKSNDDDRSDKGKGDTSKDDDKGKGKSDNDKGDKSEDKGKDKDDSDKSNDDDRSDKDKGDKSKDDDKGRDKSDSDKGDKSDDDDKGKNKNNKNNKNNKSKNAFYQRGTGSALKIADGTWAIRHIGEAG